MHAKWPLLLKIQLMGLTGINRAKNSGDAKEKRKTAGGIVALAVVGAGILFYAAMIAVGFCAQGLGKNLPALVVALASVIIFAFTLFQGSSILFATKDHDTVMSLPIPRWQVVLARMLCSYVVNLAFALAVAVPVTVVYFIFDGFSLGAFGTILLSVLTTPLLPLAVSAALSTLIAALTARMRFKNLLQSILGIALFVGVMIASFSFSFSASANGEADMSALFAMLDGKIYPPALLVDMTLSGAVWGVFAFAGISLRRGGSVRGYRRVLLRKDQHRASEPRGARGIQGEGREELLRVRRARQKGAQTAVLPFGLPPERGLRGAAAHYLRHCAGVYRPSNRL